MFEHATLIILCFYNSFSHDILLLAPTLLDFFTGAESSVYSGSPVDESAYEWKVRSLN